MGLLHLQRLLHEPPSCRFLHALCVAGACLQGAAERGRTLTESWVSAPQCELRVETPGIPLTHTLPSSSRLEGLLCPLDSACLDFGHIQRFSVGHPCFCQCCFVRPNPPSFMRRGPDILCPVICARESCLGPVCTHGHRVPPASPAAGSRGTCACSLSLRSYFLLWPQSPFIYNRDNGTAYLRGAWRLFRKSQWAWQHPGRPLAWGGLPTSRLLFAVLYFRVV